MQEIYSYQSWNSRNKSIYEIRFKYVFTLANYFISTFDSGLWISFTLHFRSYDFVEYLFSFFFFFSITFQDWTRCARVLERCISFYLSPSRDSLSRMWFFILRHCRLHTDWTGSPTAAQSSPLQAEQLKFVHVKT